MADMGGYGCTMAGQRWDKARTPLRPVVLRPLLVDQAVGAHL